jgi:NAD(P)-dependent dehydrogenase (short-subunit alcohol dehydrogenase family)
MMPVDLTQKHKGSENAFPGQDCYWSRAIGATPSAAYSAAKANALTKNLAIELAPCKIRVNTIAPGVIERPAFNTFLTRAGRAAWPASVQPNSAFDETRASD